MKVKLSQIKRAEQAIVSVLTAKTTGKTAYLLSRSIKPLINELQEIESRRTELIESLGEQLPNGQYRVLPNNEAEYIGQFNELLNTEIELQFDKIQFNLLEGITLSADDVIAIEPFIDFEEDT